MDTKVVECDPAERDVCVCAQGGRGATLAVLQEVQRGYEERMALVERVGGANKLQMQVDVLRSWVGDLTGQNTLLARAVEELEAEATARLRLQRRRHDEVVVELRAEAAALRRRLSRKESDLRGLVEVLRRLREFDYCTLDGIHFFEVTESDIFGTVEWRQKKLDDGDKRKMRHDLGRLEGYRHFKWDSKKKICGNVTELKILNDSLQKENIAKDREIRRLNKDVQQYEQTIINLRNEMSLNKHYNSNVPKKDAEVMAGMCCTGNECGDWEPVRDTSLALREETAKYQERMLKMEASLKESSGSVRSLRKANAALASELHGMRQVCAVLQEQCRAQQQRTQFKEDIIREMRRQLNKAKNMSFESCLNVSESPRPSPQAKPESPGVRFVENSPQAPILVSDDSISELSHHTPCSSARAHSPRKAKKENIREQHGGEDNKREDKRGVEELFFNTAGSNASEVGNPCTNDESERTLKLKKICSCLLSKETKSAAKSLPLCKIIQESGGASSAPDTESSSWDADARAQYYHHKLIATLQVLANKEETVRVQAESLRVAEARIAALSARAGQLRAQLDEAERRARVSVDKTERADVSVTADVQELQDQKALVKTLQTNLSVIEDLYRECFYEAAKQEEMIELLRKSYLDVRLMEETKSEQIGRLQHVVDKQKWSLEECQDMSMEVDNLKMKISNFLNGSNNDSGVWERDEPAGGEVLVDLRDITEQLLQLRDMLTGDCTCGMEDENMKLKDINEKMEIKLGAAQQRVRELETALAQAGQTALSEQLAEKEAELAEAKRQLSELQASARDRGAAREALAAQLSQAQASLESRGRELAATTRRAEQSGAEAAALVKELAQARRHALQQDDAYRESCSRAAELQSQLEAAHARGEALCGEVRRAVCAVQRALARMRNRNRAQEDKILEQESIIKALQKQNNREHENVDECCYHKPVSLTPKRSRGRVSETTSVHGLADDSIDKGHSYVIEINKDTECQCSATKLAHRKPSEMGSFICSSRGERRHDRATTSRNETASCDCSRVGEGRRDCSKASASEAASCSSAPTPPRRLLKKKETFNPCDDKSCWWGRDASAQQPTRSDARTGTYTIEHARVERLPREASPSAELEQRVCALRAALRRARSRWRPRTD